MRNLNEIEVRELIDLAFADVEAQIIHEIKAHRTDRAALLSQLDVLTKTEERVNARLERTDPLN
jgi:hypothetical protein